MAGFQTVIIGDTTYEYPAEMRDSRLFDLLRVELDSANMSAPSRNTLDIEKEDVPRGVRNNNPGNIDFREDTVWEGQLGREKNKGRFVRFDTPEKGVRAMTKILQTYNDRGQRTLKDIIFGIPDKDGVRQMGWAPEVENDSQGYVDFLVDRTGFKQGEPLDLTDHETLLKVLSGIIRFENGTDPYSDTTILQGIDEAIGKPLDLEELLREEELISTLSDTPAEEDKGVTKSPGIERLEPGFFQRDNGTFFEVTPDGGIVEHGA
jgi:hypothetical protein